MDMDISNQIVVRNLRFKLDDDVPQYWLGGARSVSLLLDHLSVIFPPGEAFFMESVRALEANVHEPRLRAEIRAFHAQEGLHGREHRRHNQRLRTFGYPVDAIDRSARRLLGVAKFALPRSGRLAVTAALEHFTALLAQVALPTDSFLSKGHPEMSALWRWHAAEENEHAAVAYDLLHEVSGSYALRVGIMALTTLGFIGKVLQHQIMMMRADGILFDAREWASLYRFLFRDPAIVARVFKPYISYYKPSFHPHQMKSSELLEAWRVDFARDVRYRRSALASLRNNRGA
jgi:predicted metal-dependent hydrolase